MNNKKIIRSILRREGFMEGLSLTTSNHLINFCLWHRQQDLIPFRVGADKSIIKDRAFFPYKDILCLSFAENIKDSLLAKVRLIGHENGCSTGQGCDPYTCISPCGTLGR